MNDELVACIRAAYQKYERSTGFEWSNDRDSDLIRFVLDYPIDPASAEAVRVDRTESIRMPELFEHVTEYTVCGLPFDHIEHPIYAVQVERRSLDKWRVYRFKRVLSADGVWESELHADADDDEWLATHRFDLQTALKLAGEAAARLVCNGQTAADVLAQERAA